MNLETIIHVVCREYKMPRYYMTLNSRQRNVTEVRHLIYYLARMKTKLTTTEIGREVGGRNHSMVTYAFQNVPNLIKYNKEYRERYLRINAILKDTFIWEEEHWLNSMLTAIWDKWYFLKVN